MAIMIDYERLDLDDKIHFQSNVMIDLSRIISLLRYYDKVLLYREDKYFIEFIFEEFKFKRDNYFYIDKIFERVSSDIRIGKTKNDSLIIIIEKYNNIFIS